jgi:hypothetical protein
MNAEHNNDFKEIAILSPAQLNHYTSDVDVNIHLGGVTMSYFGLNKDEAQRLFIYINGSMVPPKSLLIEEETLITGSNLHNNDFDFRNLETFDTAGNLLKNSKATVMVNSVDDVQRQKQAASQRVNQTAVLSSSKLNLVSQPQTTNPLQKQFGSVQLKRSSAVDGATGTTVITSELNISPGRKPDVDKLKEMITELMPGVNIQFTLSMEQLNEGVNVLTVVVIERGGTRYQQNVSFTVSDEPKYTKPKPGVVLQLDRNNKLVANTLTLGQLVNGKQGRKKQPAKSSVKKIEGVIKKKEILDINRTAKLVETDHKLDVEIETLLPATKDQLTNQVKEARDYIRQQHELNFKTIPKTQTDLYGAVSHS